MKPTHDKVALVGSRSVLISAHALARYHERVKPAFDLAQALVDLRRVLRFAEFSSSAPGWVSRGDRAAEEWIVLSDAIAFPIRRAHIATCLTRDEPGEELRRELTDEGSQHRRQRKNKRGHRTEYGKVAREARRRRRDLREAADG